MRSCDRVTECNDRAVWLDVTERQNVSIGLCEKLCQSDRVTECIDRALWQIVSERQTVRIGLCEKL